MKTPGSAREVAKREKRNRHVSEPIGITHDGLPFFAVEDECSLIGGMPRHGKNVAVLAELHRLGREAKELAFIDPERVGQSTRNGSASRWPPPLATLSASQVRESGK